MPQVNMPQIAGSFEINVTARFDDLSGGVWQSVFDLGTENEPAQNNLWLGQFAGTNAMRFEMYVDGTLYSMTGHDAIIEGEVATWTVAIDDAGMMSLQKNGVAIAQAQGVVPPDMERDTSLVGESTWGPDTALIGEVTSFVYEGA
jgi:hypothetical protein